MVTLDGQILGVPVVVDGKSLFVIPDNLPKISPERRSQKITEQVELFAKNTLIPIDSPQVGELGGKMVFMEVPSLPKLLKPKPRSPRPLPEN